MTGHKKQTDEEPGALDFGEDVICGWCDKPLTSIDHVRDFVCLRCYDLLHGAGVSAREIFEKARQKNAKDPE